MCVTALLDLDLHDRPPPLRDTPARQAGTNRVDLPPAAWGDAVVVPRLCSMLAGDTARERLLGVHMVETLVR